MSESVRELKQLVGEYKFYLGGLSPVIRIKLWRTPGKSGQVDYTQSHHIKTPGQAGAYHTSLPFADDEDSALRRAISGLTQYYDQAVKNGHEPSNAWLHLNEDF